MTSPTTAMRLNAGERWCSSKESARLKPSSRLRKRTKRARPLANSSTCWSICPATRLAETIPNFHNTRKRFIALQKAIETDHANRAKDAKKEIEFALKQEKIVDVILTALAKKKIPERITHNDTKFNNVMLDVVTGKAMCVVDLIR